LAASNDLLDDFNRRIEGADPEWVIRRGGYTGLPVHPTADATEELARIGGCPEECRWVDVWWSCTGRVYLVEVWGDGVTQRTPGVYYRTDHLTHVEYLQVQTLAPLITQPILLTVLDALETVVNGEALLAARATRPEGAVRVADLPESLEGGE
jgi:hypothetical protein